MAGLGLVNALRSYQQGLGWHQQQQELARQQQRQALMEAANKSAADVLEASKAEWAMSGAHGQWAPNDSTMLKAAQARGDAFAKAGDWENYLANEAAVQKQRVRLRAGAMQKYEANGDAEGLLRAVGPTIGLDITEVRKEGGMPALPSIGREATPVRLRFKTSDGRETETSPDDLVRMVKSTLIDPVVASEMEIKANFQRRLADIEAAKQERIAQARGRETRETEGLRQQGRVGLAGVKFGYDTQRDAANNEARLDRATLRADVTKTEGAADRASREKIAAARDQTGLAAANIRASGGGRAGGGSNRLFQSTFVGEGGWKYGIPWGGTEKDAVPITVDGKPVKDQSHGRRVDQYVAALAKDINNIGKSSAELRKMAEAELDRPPPVVRQPQSPQMSGQGAQGARDVEAGKLMIRSEYGGDVGRAKRAVQEMLNELAGQRSAEARAVLQGEIARLEAGIKAMEGGGRAPLSNFGAAPQQQRPPLSQFQR